MTTFNEDVLINGSLQVYGTDDVAQVEIRGTADQSFPLQTWANSTGEPLAQVTSDGRLELGTLDMGTPDALIEANNAITLLSSVPLRGVQSLGRVTANFPQTLGDGIAWSVQELELLGNAVVSGIHTALRGRLTQQNTGNADQAELRAADFEAINEGGNGTQPVSKMVGVQSTVTNEVSGHLNEAVGISITINDEGTSPVNAVYGLRVDSLPTSANEAYAIHTGNGPVHFGDYLELAAVSDPPTSNPGSGAQIYSKAADNKLYARTPSGEYELGSSVGAGAPTGSILMWVTNTAPSGWLLCAGQLLSMTTYKTLLDVLLTDIAVADLGLSSGMSCTANSANDTFTATVHGLTNNTVIMFSATTLPGGISNTARYFVINATTNTFQVSTTQGGTAVDLTSNGSGVLFYTQFKNIDLRGRFPLGQDDMGGTSADRVTSAQADNLGGTNGEETHTLTVPELPSHDHPQKVTFGTSSVAQAYRQGGTTCNRRGYESPANCYGTDEEVHTLNTGSGVTHNNMPPYLTLNYIIKS